jgi:antitoxin ParD1/3/4
MATLTIKLPAELKTFVEEAVSKEPDGDASRFIADLVRAERRRRAEAYLIQLVKEADDSGPATPMTKEDWQRIREEGLKRIRQKKARNGKTGKTTRSRKRSS